MDPEGIGTSIRKVFPDLSFHSSDMEFSDFTYGDGPQPVELFHRSLSVLLADSGSSLSRSAHGYGLLPSSWEVLIGIC